MPELKDWLNSINKKTCNLLEDDEAGLKEQTYLPFIINRCLSYYPDLIFLVNEMNSRAEMDFKLQYDFLFHTISKANRFSPWQKKEKDEAIEAIKEYYGYSEKKAQDVKNVISKNQLTYILERISEKKMVMEKQKPRIKKEKKAK
jgi:hypothetical protein